ncbi:MAG: N-acetylneuraminate synthase family protein, partial [Candidatus Yanofskybacteria bacterium]|nr:N-acetylneuraminate synthase family protein [Candidatus Yanofskybacteria bacterium]
PAKDSELHLANISRLIREYPEAVVGYSGHEVGVYSSLVAAALGACIIERHITLDRAMWGSDQAASLEMIGLHKLVKELRSLKKDYLGKNIKVMLDSEKPIEAKLRRKRTL